MKLWVFIAFALTTASGAYFMRGDAPIDAKTTALSASACAECHEAEHAEWATSRHASAFTNGIFRAEFETRPRDWCVHCHAPLKEQLDGFHTGTRAALVNEGVNCATCHVRDGRIHARSISGRAPHRSVAMADFGSPQFCGGCHDFNFPRFDANEVFAGSTAHPMQATVRQFEVGPYAGGSCADCHGSVAKHAFKGSHNQAMLEHALKLEVCRDGGQVVTRLTNIGAGHNVPTGDVHRHVTLRVWRSSAPEKLLDVYIGRRFTPDPTGGNFTSEDTTLAPLASRTDSVAADALGGAVDEPVNVELRYVYVVDEFPRAARAPIEPTFSIIRLERAVLSALAVCVR